MWLQRDSLATDLSLLPYARFVKIFGGRANLLFEATGTTHYAYRERFSRRPVLF